MSLPSSVGLPVEMVGAFRARGGMLTLTELARCGADRSEVQRWVRQRFLVRVRVGVFMLRDEFEKVTSEAGRHVLLARAAALTMGSGWVFSHDSAAHLQGLAFLRPASPVVHTTQLDLLGGWRVASGVKHHGAPYLPSQVTVTPYGPALDLARTACDLVREHGLQIGLSACDSAFRLGVTPAALVDAAGAMGYWRHVKTVRRAVALADPGAENPAETLARLMVIGLGIGDPITQFPVPKGGSTAWLDLLVGAHGFEVDGRLKYRRVENGGVATKDPGEVVWDERLREQTIMRNGLAVSRMTFDDLLARNWDATTQRLRREVVEARSRVRSATPPHLLAYAERLADQRARRLRATPAPL